MIKKILLITIGLVLTGLGIIYSPSSKGMEYYTSSLFSFFIGMIMIYIGIDYDDIVKLFTKEEGR